ncbi:hypothetical protein OROGR_033092 [Orobanche gracilis]
MTTKTITLKMNMNPLVILLEKNSLTGPNFVDWFRNLMIVLSIEGLGYVLEEEIENHEKWVKDDVKVRAYMMASMSNELQMAHEKMTSARQILSHLTELYGEHSRTAKYEISKQLFGARMKEGEKVGDHVLKMISMIERLEALDFKIHESLQIDLILQSLPDFFSPFVMNFNCNEIACNLAGLMNKLVIAQSQMKTLRVKESALVISSGLRKSKNKKKKTKKRTGPQGKDLKAKGKAPMVPKSKKVKRDDCLKCGELGHWPRDCPILHGTSDMERSRKLGADEVMVTVESGHSVATTDIGSLLLDLESDFVLTLDDILVVRVVYVKAYFMLVLPNFQ